MKYTNILIPILFFYTMLSICILIVVKEWTVFGYIIRATNATGTPIDSIDIFSPQGSHITSIAYAGTIISMMKTPIGYASTTLLPSGIGLTLCYQLLTGKDTKRTEHKRNIYR